MQILSNTFLRCSSFIYIYIDVRTVQILQIRHRVRSLNTNIPFGNNLFRKIPRKAHSYEIVSITSVTLTGRSIR